MAKGGRYADKSKNVLRSGDRVKHGAAAVQDMPVSGEKKKGNKKKIVAIVLVALALLLVVGIGVGVWYYNHLLNMVTRPEQITMPSMPTMSAEEEMEMLGTLPPETSPEDTWPVIVSDQNITNIMLVGQAARVGEDYRLSDSMILCSINRETKTLTLTSFMRDMRVVVPAYAGHTQGFSRMNVCYHLGSHWTGEVKGSMEMLAMAVEQNFGVHVDHTVEVNFDAFKKVVDLLGGVEVDLSEAEAKHMTVDLAYKKLGTFEPGVQVLDGRQALAYARIRKIDNDVNRTNRQRLVIISLLKSLMSKGIIEINDLFKEVLPYFITDMSNEEITNYAFEFIPMLTSIEIKSQSVPFEGTYNYTNIGTSETPDYVVDANLKKNGEMLRESLGIVPAEDAAK